MNELHPPVFSCTKIDSLNSITFLKYDIYNNKIEERNIFYFTRDKKKEIENSFSVEREKEKEVSRH